MTKTEAQLLIKEQPRKFGYDPIHLLKNTFLQFATIGILFMISILLVWAWLFNPEQFETATWKLPVMTLGLYIIFIAIFIWARRVEQNWMDEFILQTDGICRKNPKLEDIFLEWNEIDPPSVNICRDEIHIISRKQQQKIIIDVSLIGFSEAQDIIYAMTSSEQDDSDIRPIMINP